MKPRRIALPFYFVILVSMSSALPVVFAQAQIDKNVSKDAMLGGIVRDVIAPAYRELNARCRLMTNSFAQFNTHPDAGSLDKARQAWLETLLAARRIQWLQSGPVADREFLASLYYSRVTPPEIEAAVHATQPINDAYIQEIGPMARGLFAIEYLLYGRKTYPPTDPKTATTALLAGFSQPTADRRKQLLLALAQDLEHKSAQLVNDWSATAADSPAAKFISGGQQTLNVLVNELAHFVEQVEEQHVHFVLVLPNPVARQMDRIENSSSDSSQQSLVEMLEGVEKLFHAKGADSLRAYVAKINPSLDARLNEKLDRAFAAVRAIKAPLEQQVQTDRKPVEASYDKLHDLELFCKVDLASTLGVTITFNSTDGD
jgi:predicted lipoprotein